MKITLHNKLQIKGPSFRLSLFFVSLFFLLPSLADNAKGQDIPCLHNSHVLGMSTVLSGPVAHLGINMRNGVLAALKEINVHGGIQGKSLCLVVLNDGYDPERTVLNMHRQQLPQFQLPTGVMFLFLVHSPVPVFSAGSRRITT
jgi:hypothetical protein